jgi:hypothetical protein
MQEKKEVLDDCGPINIAMPREAVLSVWVSVTSHLQAIPQSTIARLYLYRILQEPIFQK